MSLRHFATRILLLAILLLASAAATANAERKSVSDDESSESNSRKKGLMTQGIAIAPFVGEDGKRARTPDIADRLATSLAEQSHWIVNPNASGLPVSLDPDAGRVRGWANRIGVAAIIVGEISGDGTVVDLRSGHSGSSLNRYPIATDLPAAQLDARVREIAVLVLADLERARPRNLLPPVAAVSPASASEDDSPFGLFTSDKPIRIDSEELEVVSEGDSRRLIFTDDVRVVQGETRLFASRLVAFYPPGASQPERLEASGAVRVLDGEREVRCLRATYFREEGVILCVGDAILIQGCDEVRGSQIEFDLNREAVKVIGAASVVLRPDSERAADCAMNGNRK